MWRRDVCLRPEWDWGSKPEYWERKAAEAWRVAALVRKTAAYFKMELAAFLAESFHSGLAHAEDHMAMQEEMPASSPDNRVIDDGIPF